MVLGEDMEVEEETPPIIRNFFSSKAHFHSHIWDCSFLLFITIILRKQFFFTCKGQFSCLTNESLWKY